MEIRIYFHFDATVAQWRLGNDCDHIDPFHPRLNNIRGGFGVRVSGPSSNASDQWSSNNFFMIFTNDLLDIFVTLKWDVTDKLSIPIDKSLASSCITNFDSAVDRA
jgi:hypothetical protein